MTHDADDESLFDPDAPASPEVARLERLLRPLGVRDGAPIPSARRSPRLLVAVCAAAALIGGIFWYAGPPAPKELAPPPSVAEMLARRQEQIRKADPEPPMRCFVEGGLGVSPGEWVETGDAPREIKIAEVSNVTVGPHTRLQVRHVRDDEARLYLERGSIEALVSADARPRFFQVDTDAARCVDLGCRYTLDVDKAGTATVRVTTGQVAFEHSAREVFIPAGAVCVARKGGGPGTPRFEDASPALKAAFDAYDAAVTEGAPAERRLALASEALVTVSSGRDTLPAWHLLSAADAKVAEASHARLSAVSGDAPQSEGAARVEVWRARLSRDW